MLKVEACPICRMEDEISISYDVGCLPSYLSQDRGVYGESMLCTLTCHRCGISVEGYWEDEESLEHARTLAFVAAAMNWNAIPRPYLHTCEVLGEDYDELLEYWETELSCGHVFHGMAKYVNYCPNCGAKVVDIDGEKTAEKPRETETKWT